MKAKSMILSILAIVFSVCAGCIFATPAVSVNTAVEGLETESVETEDFTQSADYLPDVPFDVYLPEHYVYDEKDPSVITGFSASGREIIRSKGRVKMALPSASSIKSVKSQAFHNQYCIQSLYVPNNIVTIGSQAFAYAENLTDIQWQEGGEGLTLYGQTFCEVSSLEKILLPARLQSIEGGCFAFSSNLKSIKVANANTRYTSRDRSGNEVNAVIDLKFNELLIGCVNTKIPNYITAIGDQAFSAAPITKLELPNSIRQLYFEAFYGLDIRTIKLPENLTRIGQMCFYCCHDLVSVTMPNVKEIYFGPDIFLDCENLECIVAKDAETAAYYLEKVNSNQFPFGISTLSDYADCVTYGVKLNLEFLDGSSASYDKLFKKSLDWTLLEDGTWDKQTFALPEGEWFDQNGDAVDFDTLTQKFLDGEVTDEITLYQDVSLISGTGANSAASNIFTRTPLWIVLGIIGVLVLTIVVRVNVKKPEEIE